jgi:hypothetical protein
MLQSRFSDSRVGNLVRFRKIKGLGITECHTLGIPIAKIALKHFLPPRIKPHGAKRAGGNAHLAADAKIVIDHDPAGFGFPMNSFFGTGGHARRVFTVLAADREKPCLASPRKNANPRLGRIADTKPAEGAGDLALSTAGAFIWICYEYFTGHKAPFFYP